MDAFTELSERVKALYRHRAQVEETRTIPGYQRKWALSDIDREIDALEEEIAAMGDWEMW